MHVFPNKFLHQAPFLTITLASDSPLCWRSMLKWRDLLCNDSSSKGWTTVVLVLGLDKYRKPLLWRFLGIRMVVTLLHGQVSPYHSTNGCLMRILYFRTLCGGEFGSFLFLSVAGYTCNIPNEIPRDTIIICQPLGLAQGLK